MASLNAEDFAPQMMRDLKQWCIYKLVKKEGKEKPDKVPFNANKPNKHASSTDPSTWADMITALDVYSRGESDGISFMLKDDNGLVFIDLDGCREKETGFVDDWALYWVKRFNSYTEISQSGTGLHIFIRAKMVGGGKKNQARGVEVYYKERQACMNNNVFLHYKDLKFGQDTFDEFMAEYFPDYQPDNPAPKASPVLAQLPTLGADAQILQPAIDKFCSKEERRHMWFQYGIEEADRDASQSGIDWAIAIGGVRLGFSDAIIAALITHNRQMFGQTEKLIAHPKYLSITVGNAREFVRQEQNQHKARAEENSNIVNIQFRSDQPLPDTTAQVKETQHDALGPDFRFLNSDEVMEQVKEVDWLAHGYVPLDSIVWWFGKPSAGKTFAVMSLAMAVATGTRWGSIECLHGGVAYVCGEGLSGIGKRLLGLKKQLGVSPNNNLLISSDAVLFTNTSQVWALIDRLRAQFVAPPLRLLVIDTKTANMDGAENDSEVMGKMVRHLRLIQKAFGCAVVVIDHVSKGDESRERGSSVQTGAAEVSYLIKRLDDASVDGNANVAFRSEMLCAKPPKDFEEPGPLSFEAQVVPIGSKENPKRSTLVMEPMPPRVLFRPQMRVSDLTNNQAVCLDELRRMRAERAAELATREINEPVRVSLREWRKACRDKEVSRNSVYECTEFLIENNFVFLTPPSGDKEIEKSGWIVTPFE